MSAYACEPGKGSEPGVGWEYAKNLAKMCEIWVATRANNRSVIENELSKQPVENLHFVFIDLPRWARFWKSGKRGMHLYYCLWQIFLLKKIRTLHRESHFDIIHHLTFGNVWLPTLLSLMDIPFVWGPLGGGETIPVNFTKHFRTSAKLLECLRRSIIATIRFNPFFRYCCGKAKVIIVKTEHTANLIPERYRSKVTQMTDVGIYTDSDDGNVRTFSGSSVRIICVGDLVYWRGFDMAIRAFARARSALVGASLVIAGDGPERRRLKKISDEERVSDRVIFLGRISEKMLNHEMNISTIFLNTCLKEGGVTILLDAMARGMPVISVDTGGVTNIVPMITVPLHNPEQAVSMLADALLEVCQDSALRDRMGRACKVSAEEHAWEEKAKKVCEIYKREATTCVNE